MMLYFIESLLCSWRRAVRDCDALLRQSREARRHYLRTKISPGAPVRLGQTRQAPAFSAAAGKFKLHWAAPPRGFALEAASAQPAAIVTCSRPLYPPVQVSPYGATGKSDGAKPHRGTGFRRSDAG